MPQAPENTSSQIGDVSKIYVDFEFGRTYYYSSSGKDVYEPRNYERSLDPEEEDESGEEKTEFNISDNLVQWTP